MRAVARFERVSRRRWGATHIRVKLVTWRLAATGGRIIEWLCTAERPAFFTLALAVSALLWFDWWTVLGIYVALLLVWFAAKAKKRVVIETFQDHTTATSQPGEGTAKERPDPHRPDASGMAGLLATELAEMRIVYQLLEEPLGRPRPGGVEGAVQLEDIGDVLRSAFTAQSNLTIGPLVLPFGGFMALLSRLMQAPRLRGAIYGDETGLTLTAALTMQGHDYAWTVTRRVGEPGHQTQARTALGHGWAVRGDAAEAEGDTETPMRARAEMVRELAYRVFTDLSLRGQAEWPATRDWLDALRERQACQRTPRDRRLHLEAAEMHLRKALAQDERFYLAAYNLGIVYRQLAEEDTKRASASDRRRVPAEPYTRSALRVFAHAVERLDRGRWEAYYGLALAHWTLAQMSAGNERRIHRVVDLCDRALELHSGRAARAQIQDLKATAQLALGQKPAALATWHKACESILRELTLAQTWRVPPSDGQRIVRLRKQASQCLLNLAIASNEFEPDSLARPAEELTNLIDRVRRRRRFARILALGEFAVRLTDVDAAAHKKLALIARRWGRTDLARDELQRAIRMDPDNAANWALQAEMCSTQDLDAARAACLEALRAIDFGAAPEDEVIESLKNAYTQLDDPQQTAALTWRCELGKSITRALDSDRDSALQQLRQQVQQCERDGRDWEAAIVERHLGRLLLESEDVRDAEQAEDVFDRAIRRLEHKHHNDIRRWGLRSQHALAIARQPDRTGAALPLAEQGVRDDPLSAAAWRALAIVSAHGGHYDRASTAWSRAHLLDTEDPDSRVALALCQWQQAETVGVAVERQKLHREARDHLRRSLRLYDIEQIDERRRAEWWTAKCHWSLGQFDQMPPHLLFIIASLERAQPAPKDDALKALLELALAQSYRQTRHFAEAEAYAHSAIDDSDTAAKKGVPAHATPGSPLGEDQWSLGAIRVLARAELAGCHADRNGRRDLAAELCNDGQELAVDVREEERTEVASELLSERGRIELSLGHLKEAVNLLEQATVMAPGSAGAYVSLARAYERLTFEQGGPAAALALKARESCERAKEIICKPHLQWDLADQIERRLDAAGAVPGQADVAATAQANTGAVVEAVTSQR